MKRAVGKAAYVASALTQLARNGAASYAVEIDGTVHAAASVLIAKGHYYGGRFVIASRARLDEPLLHVALFGGGGRCDVVRYARALAAGRIDSLGDVHVLPAREVRVTGRAGEAVQMDGDLAGALPLVATVAPRPIALLR